MCREELAAAGGAKSSPDFHMGVETGKGLTMWCSLLCLVCFYSSKVTYTVYQKYTQIVMLTHHSPLWVDWG